MYRTMGKLPSSLLVRSAGRRSSDGPKRKKERARTNGKTIDGRALRSEAAAAGIVLAAQQQQQQQQLATSVSAAPAAVAQRP